MTTFEIDLFWPMFPLNFYLWILSPHQKQGKELFLFLLNHVEKTHFFVDFTFLKYILQENII